MIYEGHDQPDLLRNGLAISRAIHDRYKGDLRNPYNEIECSDHYSRAMASYGVFQAICGYQHHGPNGYLAFAPRMTPDDFRCAFTAANAWGTFDQKRTGDSQTVLIAVHDGTLELNSLEFVVPKNLAEVRVTLDSKNIDGVRLEMDGARAKLLFSQRLSIGENATLRLAAIL